MINIQKVAISAGQNPDTITDWLPIFYLAQKQVGIVGSQNGQNFGGTIFFPAGNYQFSGTLQLFKSLVLKGEGRESTIFTINNSAGLICHATSTAILHNKGYELLTPTLPSLDGLEVSVDELINTKSRGGGTIEGITLQYEGQSGHFMEQERLARCGIIMHYGIVVKDCHIIGFPQDGIRIDAQIATLNGGSLFFQDLYATEGFIGDPLHPDLGTVQAWYATSVASLIYNIPITHSFWSREFKDINKNLPITLVSSTLGSSLTDWNYETNPNNDNVIISIEYDGQLEMEYYEFDLQYTNIAGHAKTKTYKVILHDANPQTYFPNLYTNANFWHVRNTWITQCGRHGLFTRGWDVNIGTAINVACTNNGTWGFSENSNLGNAYIGCFSKNNGVGNFLSGDNTSLVNDSVFIACRGFTKAEKAKIKIPNIFWGGHINAVSMNDSTPAPMINNELGHIFSSKVFRAIDNHGPIFFNDKKNPLLDENPDSEQTPPPIRVRFQPNFKEQGNVYYFDNFVNGIGGNYRLNFSNDRFKFYHAADANKRDIIHFLGQTSVRNTGYSWLGKDEPTETGSVQLAQGFFISESRKSDKRKVKVNAAAELPTIQEFNEELGTFEDKIIGYKSDILFNARPEIGGHIAWICVKSAIGNYTDTDNPIVEEEAIWKKIGNILA